jgi:serine phosphatase RsbU (regulator of sigma subunit)/anti-sigma regulatory factor (Ser/Thr protein kinase)
MTVSPDALLRDQARLDALHRVNLMGTPASEAFDRLARLAARLMHAPIGLVNFINDERQFFKGCFGYTSREMRTDWGFCPVTIARGEPLIINDVRRDPRFSSNPVVSHAGVAAYAGVPLVNEEGHALGTLCVLDYQARSWHDNDVQDLLDLSVSTLAEVRLSVWAQQRRRLFEAFEHAPCLIAVTRGPEHRYTFANAAHKRLLGPTNLEQPAQLALTGGSDTGLLEPMNTAYRTGKPVYRYETTVPEPGLADEPEQGTYTFVYSPLHAPSGDVEGLLHVAVDVTEQARTRAELAASERHVRDIAITLQESLLPRNLGSYEALEVAARYACGSPDRPDALTVRADGPRTGEEVGGDWYDVINLGVGRTALVIGDVMGRGVHAAAVMGQLRTAMRAYARLDLPPTEIMDLLDALVDEIAPEQLVTCAYAVYDPTTHQLRYANAGHLPPLLVGPNGSVRWLDGAQGTPLGTKGGPYLPGVVDMPPGATLALYTDGLVEERRQDIDVGMDRLAAVLTEQDDVLADTCERTLKQLLSPDGQSDDVALLLCRVPVPAAATSRAATLRLGDTRVSASQARQFTTATLGSWGLRADVVDPVVLVVSELVSNALLHAGGGVELRLRRTQRELHLEVCDGRVHLPHRRSGEPSEEGGRGLHLVDHFSRRWGARQTESGKSVWCEFDLAAAGTAHSSARA